MDHQVKSHYLSANHNATHSHPYFGIVQQIANSPSQLRRRDNHMVEPEDETADTPAAQGFAMPAEWMPHQATWISWPHKRESWPGKFETVEPVMTAAVAALAKGEVVRINVLDRHHEKHVQELLDGRVDREHIVFHRIPTNDAWCRDHGAIFVTRDNVSQARVALALDFRFNSWGGKYPPFDLDDAVPPKMAEALGIACYPVDMVLEGGSIDVNGHGALLTTEQCLLNPNRNPDLQKQTIEQNLRDTLGVRQIVWLGEGIVGDDTDGHIDDLTRFVSEDTVVTVIESDRHDENYALLAENRARLNEVRLAGDRRLNVVELAMPQPVDFKGDRLPASYANFYIGNSVILMPAFDDPADEPNRRVLASCFPTRKVVPIDCSNLVLGLGTFHCLTQQVPVF
jgi:agmatine deiminase